MSSAVELATSLARIPKVLVVDDDHFIRLMFAKLQAKFELTISAVASPQEALALLEKEKYDLCFLDMRFNQPVEGMDLLRTANSKEIDLHIVIMSGSINLHDVMLEANKLGVVSFMVKPVSLTPEFLALIMHRLGVRMLPRPISLPVPLPSEV